jgi:hypothetical protein
MARPCPATPRVLRLADDRLLLAAAPSVRAEAWQVLRAIASEAGRGARWAGAECLGQQRGAGPATRAAPL